MYRLFVAALASALSLSAMAKDVPVKGHFKKDGGYVAPSHRTSPNTTRTDNYSSRGNGNPYTGKPGQKNP